MIDINEIVRHYLKKRIALPNLKFIIICTSFGKQANNIIQILTCTEVNMDLHLPDASKHFALCPVDTASI